MPITHEVFNQVPPRVNLDEFTENLPLIEAVQRYDAVWALDALTGVGIRVGTEEFQDDAARANRIEPELHTHDRYGNRIDEVEYDSSYSRMISAAVAAGAHTAPGPSRARARTSPERPRSCSSRRSNPGTPARSR